MPLLGVVLGPEVPARNTLLDFLITLLDQSTSKDEYELPFIDALAVLGLD